jgi:hypothetical protein
MTQVHTDLGIGEIVETQTVRGRTSYRVAGIGGTFNSWFSETEALREAARGFDFEPTDHVMEGNEVDLPYNFEPQFPVDMFRNEQTISPDHQIDRDERMRPTKSRSMERGRERPYPGPNPDLFAPRSSFGEHTSAYAEPERDLDHDSSEYEPRRPMQWLKDTADQFHNTMDKRVTGSGPSAWDSRSHPHLDHEIGRDEGYDNMLEHDEPFPHDELPPRLGRKYAAIAPETPNWNDPVVQFRHDPNGTIVRYAALDIEASGLDPRVGEDMAMVMADKSIHTAAWRDVSAKAKRLRHEGAVHVEDMSHDRIYASVDGDTGTYQVMIAKGGDYGQRGQSISNWHCSCPWGRWAFKRQQTFVGRLCSHGYATYLEMQSAHMKDNPEHFRPRRASRRVSGVDAFKTWCNDTNDGHIDLDAADRYISTQEEPLDKEEAQKIYDYADSHVSVRPERDYDQDDYNLDNEEAYKTADLLRVNPKKLTPDLVVVETHEGDDAHYFTDLGDDRETTGPTQIVSNKTISAAANTITAKSADEGHHPAFAWHDDREEDFPEQGIVHLSGLIYVADDDLLSKLRGLSEAAPHLGDMRDHNHEVSEVVSELRDRGYDADQIVARYQAYRQAALKRYADSAFDELQNAKSDQEKNRTAPPPQNALQSGPAGPPDSVNIGPNIAGGGGPLQTPGGSQPINPTHGKDAPAPSSGIGPAINGGGAGGQGMGNEATMGLSKGPAGGQGVGNEATMGLDTPKGGGGAPAPGGGSQGWFGPAAGGSSIGPGDYKIQQGDTLSGIADRAGLGGNYQDLAKSNSIANPDKIFAGDTIKIPGAPAAASSPAPAAGGTTQTPIGPVGGGSGGAGGATVKPPTPPASGIGPAIGGPTAAGTSSKENFGLGPQPNPAAPPPLSTMGIHASAERFAMRYFATESDAPDSSDNGGEKRTPMNTDTPAAGKGADYKSVTMPNGLPTANSDNGGFAKAITSPAASVANPAGITPMNPDAAAPGSSKQPQQQAGPGAGGGFDPGQIGNIINSVGQGVGSIVPGLGGLISGIGGAASSIGNMFHGSIEHFADASLNDSEGGGDWADYPFAGSGPNRRDWMGTSEDYIEDHERPNRQETWTTDNKGDITTDRRQQPKQSALTAAIRERRANSIGRRQVRRHADMAGSGNAGYGAGDGAAMGHSGVTMAPDAGGLDTGGIEGVPGGQGPESMISLNASRHWAFDNDPSQQGFFNPNVHPDQAYDKGDYGVGDQGHDDQGHGGGGGMLPDTKGGAGDIAEMAETDPEMAAMVLASRNQTDDGSDIVRQFQASMGAQALMDGSSGGGGDFDISGAASAFLKTAGRHFSPAEQRELEEESHPQGARNLASLDLRGTHYLEEI